jgi:hypothetical protein
MSIAFEPAVALASQARPRRAVSDRSDVHRSSYTQGSLALTYPLANGLPGEPDFPKLTLVEAAEACEVPPAEAWAPKFLQAVVEAVANDRHVTQLARWTTSRVYADLNARRKRVAAQLNARNVKVTRHHVATVHVCQVSPEIAEVTGRVITGRRSRALAARLEYVSSRWTCTELEFG